MAGERGLAWTGDEPITKGVMLRDPSRAKKKTRLAKSPAGLVDSVGLSHACYFPSAAFAVATTFSFVKPNSTASFSIGAEAP